MSSGVEAFRAFLASKPALDVSSRAEAPGEVVCIPAEASLEQALQTLAKNHILSAPVFPRGGPCMGLLDILDILVTLVERVEESDQAKFTNLHHKDDIVFDTVIHRDPGYWLDMAGKLALKVTHAKDVLDRSRRNPYLPLHLASNPTLLDAAALFSQGVHRVPVIGAGGRIARIISQSSIMNVLLANIGLLGDWAKQSVSEAGMFTPYVVKCAGHVKVVDAFKIMHLKGVSSIAIVDADGFLAGVLSPSDLKHLSGEHIHGKLQLSVSEFLEEVRAGQGRESNWVLAVAPTAMVEEVVRLLAGEGVHRLFVRDSESHKPVGVVSLTDILRAIFPDEMATA